MKNNKTLSLEVGKNYSLSVSAIEGASANFLSKSGNFLQICLPDLQKSEVRSIRKNTLQAGLIKDGPLILWLFKFDEELTFDCPFDVRLISKSDLALHNIDNQNQRLSIDIHLVDTQTMILKALRAVTLSPELTRAFLLEVQEQLIDTRSTEPSLNKYMQYDLAQLSNCMKLYKCGM